MNGAVSVSITEPPLCSVCNSAFAVVCVGAEPRCPGHVDTRISTLSRQVAEFHKAVGQPILDKPQVPSEERIRLRLRLITEEFFELLDAAGLPLLVSKAFVMSVINAETFRNGENQSTVSMVDLADAVADLDYVVEGTRLEFGINGAPIADEVHRSNMLKASGPVRADGKRLKPPGFQPPDVEGELRKQGWVP
jgi:predicted HAD superfamily Cof-like phosphohydrolase